MACIVKSSAKLVSRLCCHTVQLFVYMGSHGEMLALRLQYPCSMRYSVHAVQISENLF
jgi:hypothetical protein